MRKLVELFLKCLEKLNDPQFISLRKDLLSPVEQDDLTKPITKSSFLDDLERWGKFKELENTLRSNWYTLLQEELETLPSIKISQAGQEKSIFEKPFPFTNREREINEILDQYAPPYYLVDAPIGYGKTRLLEKLREKFLQKDWACAYVEVSEGNQKSQVTKLVLELIQQLDNQITVTLDDDSMPIGTSFGIALWKWWKELIDLEKEKEGIVFLIDFKGRPSLEILDKFINKIVPGIFTIINQLTPFSDQHTKFRVIFAGRNLATRTEIRSSQIPLSILRLSPFDFKVIFDAVREHLSSKYDKKRAKQLASHLFFITGGHPGCLVYSLDLFSENPLPPDQFLINFSEHIWNEKSRKVVNTLKEELTQNTHELHKFSDQLGILRCMNYDILKRMLDEKKETSEETSEYDLADELTATYLLDWKDRVLRDDIARRLLAIGLRQDKEIEFSELCIKARGWCEDVLKQPNVQQPEIWVVEYLFQTLQACARDINDPARRKEIKASFFDNDISEAIKLFITHRDSSRNSWPMERNALHIALDRDWEFQFVINYYLRENDFDEKVYTEFLHKLDKVVSNHWMK